MTYDQAIIKAKERAIAANEQRFVVYAHNTGGYLVGNVAQFDRVKSLYQWCDIICAVLPDGTIETAH
jgi:hypothetical protein